MNVLGYTESGFIRVIFDGEDFESIVPDDVANRHRQMIAEWEATGNTIPAHEPPPPSIDDYKEAIQRRVDETASARNYKDGVSLASYVASTNRTWASEAEAFVAWRDAVWAYAYAEMDRVLNAERPQPSVAELLAELPVIKWPEAA